DDLSDALEQPLAGRVECEPSDAAVADLPVDPLGAADRALLEVERRVQLADAADLLDGEGLDEVVPIELALVITVGYEIAVHEPPAAAPWDSRRERAPA